jgi:hypothetical protein
LLCSPLDLIAGRPETGTPHQVGDQFDLLLARHTRLLSVALAREGSWIHAGEPGTIGSFESSL